MDDLFLAEQMKRCSKCGMTLPATFENFFRHPSGRFGMTPRCKPCTTEDNKSSEAKRRERDLESVLAQNRRKMARHYYKDIEASRAQSRAAAARARQDPERRAIINMRRRADAAGLKIKSFEELLRKQGGKCAICGTTEPEGKTGVTGWNVDHCHKTRKVRFILCSPCNRGLAAFRDDPERLRRAAELLEDFKIKE